MNIHKVLPRVPDRRRFTMSGCVLICMLLMGNAQAQWKVVDDAGNQHLADIKKAIGEKDGNVNGNLAKLYEQQKIGSYKSGGDMAKDPDEKLDPNNPTTAVAMDSAQRCPPAMVPGVSMTQQRLCEQIVDTELAQYKYSLAMFEQTKTRHKRLQEIEQERQNIGAAEQGKLQDNSNKLLALLSLMEIDRQQQKTYMDAYEVRLRYLKAARDTLTQQALQGKAGASALSAVISGAVMAKALDESKTTVRYGSHGR